MQAQLSLALGSNQPQTYSQRGTNALQPIFKEHFQEFADTYEQKYAPTYGRFRMDRITEVVENFISCGDYTQAGGARRCLHPRRGRLHPRRGVVSPASSPQDETMHQP
ncbi:hypothetical protein LCGC14_2733160 [marine sediment metagenome]|uniref:Uncharacterized protein n=1 Tax=marine sediment metagenome TaxID=412755 RepID=A0A0F9BYE4_9ZZZZ